MGVKVRVSLVALLTLAFLSGCYDSEQDLIGDKATKVILIDSLFLHRGTVYYWLKDKQGYDFLCANRTRPDLTSACAKDRRLPVKFERTPLGNYIVQIGEQRSGGYRYSYGLWLRSRDERVRSNLPIFTCFIFLGEGVPRLGNPYSHISLTWGSNTDFQRLGNELLDITGANTSITRDDLMRIVKVYEDFMFPRPEGMCLDERMYISSDKIILERDNRHIREFE